MTTPTPQTRSQRRGRDRAGVGGGSREGGGGAAGSLPCAEDTRLCAGTRRGTENLREPGLSRAMPLAGLRWGCASTAQHPQGRLAAGHTRVPLCRFSHLSVNHPHFSISGDFKSFPVTKPPVLHGGQQPFYFTRGFSGSGTQTEHLGTARLCPVNCEHPPPGGAERWGLEPPPAPHPPGLGPRLETVRPCGWGSLTVWPPHGQWGFCWPGGWGSSAFAAVSKVEAGASPPHHAEPCPPPFTGREHVSEVSPDSAGVGRGSFCGEGCARVSGSLSQLPQLLPAAEISSNN